MGGKQTMAEVCLDLEGSPYSSLDPALYFKDVAMREESHCTGINARNVDRTRFALCDVACPFEHHGEVFWVIKKDPEVVCVRGDSGLRRIAEIRSRVLNLHLRSIPSGARPL